MAVNIWILAWCKKAKSCWRLSRNFLFSVQLIQSKTLMLNGSKNSNFSILAVLWSNSMKLNNKGFTFTLRAQDQFECIWLTTLQKNLSTVLWLGWIILHIWSPSSQLTKAFFFRQIKAKVIIMTLIKAKNKLQIIFNQRLFWNIKDWHPSI